MTEINIAHKKSCFSLPVLYFICGWLAYAVVYVLLKGFNPTWAGILSFSSSLVFIAVSLSFYVWLYKQSTGKTALVYYYSPANNFMLRKKC